jgi:RNA polymerase sigma factor (TIGR02999 family)
MCACRSPSPASLAIGCWRDAMDDVKRTLSAIERGDARAAEDLLPIVYEELRRLAHRRLAAEAPGNTLQPTALVHEAYVRLVGRADPGWQGRAHFFAAAAESMRRVLIDRARARGRQKRGGAARPVELKSSDLRFDAVPDELLDLDEALTKLAAADPLKADLVKLRFFAGLSLDECAVLLDISPASADRYWAYARAFLFDAMKGPDR